MHPGLPFFRVSRSLGAFIACKNSNGFIDEVSGRVGPAKFAGCKRRALPGHADGIRREIAEQPDLTFWSFRHIWRKPSGRSPHHRCFTFRGISG